MEDSELREHFDRIGQQIEAVQAEVTLARAETRDLGSRLMERTDHLRATIAAHFEVLELRLDEKYLPRR